MISTTANRNARVTALVLLLAALLQACQNDTPPRPTPAPSALPTVAASQSTPVLPATAVPVLTEVATLRPGEPTATPGPQPAAFFDDRRLMYEPNFYVAEVQAFLDTQPGPLKGARYQVGSESKTFAEVLVSQTSYYGVNPRVILALMQSQNGLLSNAQPSADQIGWAIGFDGDRGNWRGIRGQVRWAIRQMWFARRDYPARVDLTFSDTSTAAVSPDWTLSQYVIARVLAPTTTPARLSTLMQRFEETYTQYFGDPRLPPDNWPAPAAPFLSRPLEQTFAVTSFFDHDVPFLTRDPNGSVVTYWGHAETDSAFAYDGHDGWDYAAASPDRAIAAADGEVVFAGTADDGCATRAVVIEHGNGYRTLYWHLARVDVEEGQHVARGDRLGVVGESGCALGPHLHFGVQYLGRNVDPYGWCGGGADPWAQNPAGQISVWLWQDRPSPCGPPPANAIVVDGPEAQFVTVGEGWHTTPSGYGGSAYYAATLRGTDEEQPWKLRPTRQAAVAVWKPDLPHAGRYRVIAYIPYALSGLEDSRRTQFRVRHADGETAMTFDARTYANDWVELGTYQFNAGQETVVTLSNLTEDNQLGVWADAVMWIPVE